jgi:hypothetical protein
MRAIGAIIAIGLIATTAIPAIGADSMSMMKGGEVITVMPDGHMGKMIVTDAKMMGDMMKMAKPLDHCMMIMTDAKGKAYVVDTSTKAAMAECEKMAK